jgi:hypothetical protein
MRREHPEAGEVDFVIRCFGDSYRTPAQCLLVDQRRESCEPLTLLGTSS